MRSPNPTGTATSSPVDNTASQSDMNIVNTMLWMKKNAYEETTIRKVAKLLRHLNRNCNTKDPETGTNIEIGDNFIELWKETKEQQEKNLMSAWRSRGAVKLLPLLNIVEELTKTLKRIKKPYNQL